jgi:transposase
MIDYATWCAIRDGAAQHLTAPQLAHSLGLDVKTVRHWLGRPYQPRAKVQRPSKLDPFKGRIVAWLDAHLLSAQQVFQRLIEAGFEGGISIVKEYVHTIRPRPREAYLTLAFAPGEAAQVDLCPEGEVSLGRGEFGTITVGTTRRRLSFFVMVLAYSQQMYVEFTCSQTMEQFLAAHVNAFNDLGVPRKVMVDNLRCAALQHACGERPLFNPRYLDFARHYGFEPVACAPAEGNEKGRVERGVGYVKGNFLSGLALPDFAALNPALRVWLETVANVRRHRETQRRPVDLWTEERTHLQPVTPRPFDVGRVLVVRANRQFRVSFEGNRYSVPARFAGSQVTLKAYPDRLCLYHGEELIARHARSFDRNQDIEDPDHPKALLAQRRHARDAQVLKRFLGLSPLAAKYHAGLLERRGNALAHVRKIVALAEIHGDEAVQRAMADALAFEAFSSEYIAHLIEARSRPLPEASPLVLMRRQDVLELELQPADLSAYTQTRVGEAGDV